MRFDELAIKKSPFVFIKLLVLIEFLFALTPFVVAALINARRAYEDTALARTVSYDLLSAVTLTTLLVLVLIAAFIAWYIPTYLVSPERVLLRRGGLFSDRKLADTQQIASMHVRQGWLARRLNYGSLELVEQDGTVGVLRNIPSPTETAEQIEALIDRTLDLPAAAPPVRTPQELIAAGEGQFVEFKSSLMWDYRQRRANKDLYEPVMKNVVGFLNTRGGTLIIGVDDEGAVLGLEPDYGVMKKGDKDGFENV
ncbi:MAG: putative DNA binding domain-containing protein, partial [Caldilineaceae bacterium]|nr:putative DNA binding domain-containing protein [Caldilineaceae bacterium]